MLYLLAPWTAVNLTDYFFVRRGHYAIADLFTPNGHLRRLVMARPGRRSSRACSPRSPSSSCRSSSGPAATAIGEVDIAFIVGLLVSGLVYIGVTRSLDVSRELELINSRPELADPAGAGDVAESVAEEEK